MPKQSSRHRVRGALSDRGGKYKPVEQASLKTAADTADGSIRAYIERQVVKGARCGDAESTEGN